MEFHRLFLKLICVGLLLNPEKLNMMMFFYSNTVIVYVQLSPKKYTYCCMLYFMGKREELFDILHHMYITYKIIKNTYFEIRNVIPYDDHQRMERCAYRYF